MNVEAPGRIAELFAAASRLAPADRRAFLDREAGDTALGSEVLRLIEEADQASRAGFLGARTWEWEPAATSADPQGVPGRYEDLVEHKRGGMGVVYRARDVQLGREVAYKAMASALGSVEEFRRKFAREARITARLQYPGIVPVYEAVVDASGRPAYAMQFVDGSNFRDLIRGRDRLDDRATRRRLEALHSACRIVAYAHERRYVHGDISPRNLMIGEGGATFVVDWGLARHVGPARDGDEWEEPGPSSPEPATPGFAAPSVRRGGPRSFATDVYGLGAVLAALVVGVTPEGDPDVAGPTWKAVPRPLRAIIEAAMADRDDGPYPQAGALADDLRRYLDGDRVKVDREPTHERAWRLIRRHPVRATVVVSALLLLSIASTSVALVSAAQARAAKKDQEAQKRGDEAAQARRETLWSQATVAMIRSGAILNRNPQPEIVEAGKLELFLKVLTPLAKEKALSKEVYESLKANQEATRQHQARQEARGRAAAEPEYREVIAILTRLEGEIPDPRTLRYYLAKSQHGLGVLEMTRAISELGLLRYLLIVQANLAGHPPSQPKVEQGLARIEKAMELLPSGTPLPGEADSPHDLEQDMWRARGMALVHLGRYTEAVASFDRAFAMAEGPGKGALESLRSIFLRAAEVEQSHLPWSRPPRVDHARAIQMVDELLAHPQVILPAIYNAACVYSLASLDERASPADREARAARAIALLTRIETKGYFRESKPAGEFKTDPDLDSLRPRPDFRGLAAKVAKGG